MLSRRGFLGTSALCSSNLWLQAYASQPKARLAVLTTEWRDRSHAWCTGERFMAGYPMKGKWHRPDIQVVSAYVDQTPKADLSRARAKEHGFTIYPTIAEALRCGTASLAVDAVIIIGEHGKYANNDIGQKMYPRYEFFEQVVDVLQKDNRTIPIFNDKHLSWKWEWAKKMVDITRERKIPFLAGSSTPVTWRMPDLEMPYGADVEEVLCVGYGKPDSYDFHGLEVLQCMAERRKGGETGVVAVQALRGDAVLSALSKPSWKEGGWDPALFEACLCRSLTLRQAPTLSHRYPTPQQIREWVRNPFAYRIEHADGLKSTLLLMNGLVGDFTFAARLRGETQPLSTLFYLTDIPNVHHFAGLMGKVEEMIRTGKAPYPVERTLLTTGVVASAMQSLAANQKRLETPHLSIGYKATRESHHLRD